MMSWAIRYREKRMHRALGFYVFLLMLLFCVCLLGATGECGDLFSVEYLASEGRPLAVLPVDLDGTGPCEIIVVSRTGVYPHEKRWISIFGAENLDLFSPIQRQRWEIDSRASMFEVGDVAPSPGAEIFFLTQNGIRYYAQKTDGSFNTDAKVLLTMPTAAFFPSASHLPRMGLLADWQGLDRPSLLVPQFALSVLLSRNDTGKWQEIQTLDMPPMAFHYSNHEDDGISRTYSLRMDYRLPLPVSEDFDGDERSDLMFTENESIFVYLQRPSGLFTLHPAGRIVLPVRPEEPESSSDLSILMTPVEMNGDGFTDVMAVLSRGTGKFMERKIELHLFYNQKMTASPFASEPDQKLALHGITPGAILKDINGDGRKDLLMSYIKLGFWNTVRSLVARRTIVETAVFLMNDADRYPADPNFRLKTKYKLDLAGGVRFHGIWPNLDGDFTGDGSADLLVARDGSITVYSADEGNSLFSTSHTLSGLATYPFKHIMDLNRDGRDDILLYEKKHGGKICVLVNTGDWSGKLSSSNDGPPQK